LGSRPAAAICGAREASTSSSAATSSGVRADCPGAWSIDFAFSKKVENHAHSVALFAMYYNFVRIHKTLRTTPAMAAGVTSKLWEKADMVKVLEAWEAN